MHAGPGSVQRNPAQTCSTMSRPLNETSVEIFSALRGLFPDHATAAPQCRTRHDLAVPAYAFAAGRIQLPPSADLLGICGRSDRPLRPVGRRLDDIGAAAAMSAMGHIG